jgi:hypothetical protein
VIVRQWLATANRQGADGYRQHFTGSVLPGLTGIPGFLGAWLLEREDGDRIRIQVETRWESFTVIRGFAGERIEVAVVEPAAQSVLLDYDTEVTHYVVVSESAGEETPVPERS